LSQYGDACWAQVKPAQTPTTSKTVAGNQITPKAQAPLAFEETIELVRQAKGSPANQQKLIEIYRKRGVDFKASPENLEKLRKGGAAEEFIALIEKIAADPKPPPPPPPPTGGTVEINCSPAECQVSLGTKSAVPTQNGKYIFEGVPLGEVKLSFSKAGYDTQTRDLQVRAGTPTTTDLVTLRRNRHAEAKEWLKKVWEALGSAERGAPQQEVSASGTATLTDGNGKQTDWSIAVRFSDKTASTIDFQTSAGKPGFKILCDPTCHVLQSGGRFKPKQAIDGEEASFLMTQFRRFHLGNMVSRLSAGEVDAVSTDVLPSGRRSILLTGSGETYEIELGASELISTVSVTPQFGGEAYQVIYGEYVKMSPTALYPRRTEYHMKKDKRAFKVEFSGSISKPG
jgi:hypothetical protein